jgi:hypothetical protein
METLPMARSRWHLPSRLPVGMERVGMRAQKGPPEPPGQPPDPYDPEQPVPVQEPPSPIPIPPDPPPEPMRITMRPR